MNNAEEKSRRELMEKLGSTVFPTVLQLVQYLEEKSEFKHPGKMGTECTVNKEALRLAAVYLADAYLYNRDY